MGKITALAAALVQIADQQGLRTTTPGWKPPYDESRVPVLLREKCERKWPGDYSMQEACLRNQITGAAELKAIDERYGSQFNKQVETCVEKWTDNGTPDFSMIAACARNQIESWHRLNP